jgi:hypothetical protein
MRCAGVVLHYASAFEMVQVMILQCHYSTDFLELKLLQTGYFILYCDHSLATAI